MRSDISLYIDGQEVQFQEVPQILFTYAYTDIHNPTVIKNSFTKTITIDGCPKNEKIFGCFGDMTKIISYADGKYSGAYFNPSRKIDFVLVRNGEIIERGYVKLDKVVKQGNKIKYEITLYGGLGQMLYNLQYKEDGEQMKLSDLDYGFDMEMLVNKDSVTDAWLHINGIKEVNELYDRINFAPCYNGIPEDFSADKVAIDAEYMRLNMPEMYTQLFPTVNDQNKTVDGWIIGELAKEYDEWKTKDLRSYLQRPVIRFKEIINACCNPKNNGGYEVDLDDEFFSETNPYYDNAWMTLPLVREIEVNTIDEEISVEGDSNGVFSLTGLKNGDLFSTSLHYFLASNANVPLQTNGYGYYLTTGAYTFNRDTPLISANMAIYSQLVAYDKNGNAVGGSNVISCSRKYGKVPSDFVYDLEYKAPVTFVNGVFYYEGTDDYRYRFWREIDLGSYVGGDKPVFNLDLKNVMYSEGMYLKFVTKIATIDNGTVLGNSGKLFWSEGYDAYTAEPELLEKWNIGDITKTYNQNYISKNTLLSSENTPCDYFLNYLKMFNLHIWADNVDKKVYIRQRKNYFSDNRVNIDNLVDRGSEITITPITFDAKYYVFNNEIEKETLLNKDYKDNYGFDYGIQKINTNYNFDNSSKDLIDNNVFKGCICNRSKSKYNISIYNDYDNLPPYIIDGIQIMLYSNGKTSEGNYILPMTSAKSYNWWKEKYYDLFPKPNFLGKDGKGVDGSNILLFYNSKVENIDNSGNSIGFGVSDDIPQFEQLNEGEPCWIWSGDFDVVTQPYYLPVFSRYLTNDNGWVTHSWDFGTPRAIYIPDYSIDESSDIYTQYWKVYMNDELDVNTRIVECKMKLTGNINPDYMQSFIYFDGCYWRIQEIVDYDVSSNDFTKVKLVKINNLNSYLT